MARDPAVLMYPDDFLSGTFTMTNAQVGAYIRLLFIQNRQGHLSERTMLSVCKKRDPEIWSKFIIDEDGLYYNERMEEETLKRQAYCESRRKNKQSKEDMNTHMNEHMSQHMSEHMGNGNININNSLDLEKKKGVKGGKGKTFVPPTLEEVEAYCKERNSSVDPKQFYEYFSEGGWIDSKGNPVRNWKQKLITWEGKHGNSGRDIKSTGDTKPSARWNLKAAVDA